MGNSSSEYFSDNDHPKVFYKDWMKNIPDNAIVSKLTIPGTHDSCALHGCCCAKTQTWSLDDQLNAGLRFFDLRVVVKDNTLKIYHGCVNQKITLDEILLIFTNFLKENPTEGIFMAIVKEYGFDNTDEEVLNTYQKVSDKFKDYIVDFKGEEITFSYLRGKILFLDCIKKNINKISGFRGQNKWEVECCCGLGIKGKKRWIKRTFNKSINIDNPNKNIYVNFLSGSNQYGCKTAKQIAKYTNKTAMKYTGRLGVVLIDYPGEGLIKHLIDQNNENNIEIKKDEKNIKYNDKVKIINPNTGRYLSIAENGELICMKEPFEFLIESKDNNQKTENLVINNTEEKLKEENNEKKEEEIKCDDVIKLSGNNKIFNFVFKKCNYSINSKSKKIFNGDGIKIICNDNLYNNYIYSDYEFKDENKIQRVKVDKPENGEQFWIIKLNE